jgi:hypothetical protein
MKRGPPSMSFHPTARPAHQRVTQAVGAQHTSGVACFVCSYWFSRDTASALQEYGRKGLL